MFELVQKHLSYWSPFEPPGKPEVTMTGAEFTDSTEQLEESDLEEDFEILSMYSSGTQLGGLSSDTIVT